MRSDSLTLISFLIPGLFFTRYYHNFIKIMTVFLQFKLHLKLVSVFIDCFWFYDTFIKVLTVEVDYSIESLIEPIQALGFCTFYHRLYLGFCQPFYFLNKFSVTSFKACYLFVESSLCILWGFAVRVQFMSKKRLCLQPIIGRFCVLL